MVKTSLIDYVPKFPHSGSAELTIAAKLRFPLGVEARLGSLLGKSVYNHRSQHVTPNTEDMIKSGMNCKHQMPNSLQI
jgi:hypothetical protein